MSNPLQHHLYNERSYSGGHHLPNLIGRVQCPRYLYPLLYEVHGLINLLLEVNLLRFESFYPLGQRFDSRQQVGNESLIP